MVQLIKTYLFSVSITAVLFSISSSFHLKNVLIIAYFQGLWFLLFYAVYGDSSLFPAITVFLRILSTFWRANILFLMLFFLNSEMLLIAPVKNGELLCILSVQGKQQCSRVGDNVGAFDFAHEWLFQSPATLRGVKMTTSLKDRRIASSRLFLVMVSPLLT